MNECVTNESEMLRLLLIHLIMLRLFHFGVFDEKLICNFAFVRFRDMITQIIAAVFVRNNNKKKLKKKRKRV